MRKKSTRKTKHFSADKNTKDMVTLVILFGLILGIVFTTFIANATTSPSTIVSQAAGK